MGKGLLIFFIVLVVIAIIHFISLRMMLVTEEKKSKIRKIYWYLYGFIFIISGVVNMFPFEEFKLLFSIQFFIGLGVIILNCLGKIETKNKN